jgi:hypothetical protein
MILALQLSHFTAAVAFALFSSVVFGITGRSNPRDMFRYGAYCFAMFVVAGLFLGGWFMWLLHH